MTAEWEVVDNKIYLRRTTQNFPIDDFNAAIQLLIKDLEKEKNGSNK